MLSCAGAVAAQQVPVPAVISTPDGNILAQSGVQVMMRDGVSINVDVFRPGTEGPFPTLYAAGPLPHDGVLDRDTPAGPLSWYVTRGYAVVLANVRGTGGSGGTYSFLSREEQQDHYEIVEWIAAQDWSNGKIAGTGAGYYATAQWQMAIQNPPHLACIAPINGILDPYREWAYPGGLVSDDFLVGWYEGQVRQGNAFAGGEQSRLVEFDMRLQLLAHPAYDGFWSVRSSLESLAAITVPVFSLHDWQAGGYGISGTLEAMSRLNTINKLLVTAPDPDRPLYDNRDLLARELLPFYDWCLNGDSDSTVFIELPRIRYQVGGTEQVKPDNGWPPADTRYSPWFLDGTAGDGGGTASLGAGQRSGIGGFSEYNTGQREVVLRFTSEPLANDLEIAGPLMLELYASTTARDMAVEVSLLEQVIPRAESESGPLPTFVMPLPVHQATESQPLLERLVSRGRLKASRRSRLDDNDNPYLPRYGFNTSDTLTPGRVTRLDIAMSQAAHRFARGNRLIVEIRPVNDGSMGNVARRDSIFHNDQYPSRLWLPVAEGTAGSSGRPEPDPVAAGPEAGSIFVPR